MIDQYHSRERIVQTLFRALDLRDRESAAHSERVAMFSLNLGRAFGLQEDDLDKLRAGALLHDIGKIGIPDSILLKPEKLTLEEWPVMRNHSRLGAELISFVPELQDVVPVVLYHHEQWDGNGYPHQLAGEEIPLLARICSVTEVFDALISDCVYKPGWTKTRALEWMEQSSGKLFDPSIITVLQNVTAGL